MTSGCMRTDKVVYRTKRDAKTALRRLRHAKRSRLHAYRCDECGGWHLGHRPPWMTTEQEAA